MQMKIYCQSSSLHSCYKAYKNIAFVSNTVYIRPQTAGFSARFYPDFPCPRIIETSCTGLWLGPMIGPDYHGSNHTPPDVLWALARSYQTCLIFGILNWDNDQYFQNNQWETSPIHAICVVWYDNLNVIFVMCDVLRLNLLLWLNLLTKSLVPLFFCVVAF